MKYLYNSHLGGLYTSDEELDYDYLYCEQCGDSDTLIGSFSTIQDFWNLIKEECDINGSGGYSLQYLYLFQSLICLIMFDMKMTTREIVGFAATANEKFLQELKN